MARLRRRLKGAEKFQRLGWTGRRGGKAQRPASAAPLYRRSTRGACPPRYHVRCVARRVRLCPGTERRLKEQRRVRGLGHLCPAPPAARCAGQRHATALAATRQGGRPGGGAAAKPSRGVVAPVTVTAGRGGGTAGARQGQQDALLAAPLRQEARRREDDSFRVVQRVKGWSRHGRVKCARRLNASPQEHRQSTHARRKSQSDRGAAVSDALEGRSAEGGAGHTPGVTTVWPAVGKALVTPPPRTCSLA